MTPWPCHRCGAPGVRNLGADGWCATHLAALLATFDPVVFVPAGVGLPCGVVRPEFGPDMADLRCVACGAVWVGVAGEQCGWCVTRWEIQCAHQDEIDRRRR